MFHSRPGSSRQSQVKLGNASSRRKSDESRYLSASLQVHEVQNEAQLFRMAPEPFDQRAIDESHHLDAHGNPQDSGLPVAAARRQRYREQG